MRKIIFYSIFILCLGLMFMSLRNLNKVKKYRARIVCILYEEPLYGDIYINLAGPNDEMIKIDLLDEKTLEKKAGETLTVKKTETIKVNTGVIRSFKIDSITYSIKKIEYHFDKNYQNYCVRKITDSKETALYSFKKEGKEHYAIGFGNSVYTLTHPKFDMSVGIWVLEAFKDCPALRKKIADKEAGYYWDQDADENSKYEILKKMIAEMETCSSHE